VSHWVWFAALTLLVNAGAIGGLYYITRHDQQSAEGLAFQQQAQAQQLSILGAGLAHEVRNPLHALRINLHILRRVAERRATLPEDQLQATTRDSDTAVSRIELLLRDLLQFVEPTPGNVVEINLADEVRSAIDLLSNSLNRDQIEVDASNCTPSAVIAIDSARVRQIVLNLLEFAQTRAGRQSKLQVTVTIADSQAKLAISHPGPALTADQAEHLFEPFQSPVDVGTGLGMALVRAHVEAAGGNIRYEQPEPGQNRLVMSLPICRSA
jgi:C4-dicarboxylate-specific signal transduction histidine kinase